MNYKNVLADFAERTLANLKQIRCLDEMQERINRVYPNARQQGLEMDKTGLDIGA